MMFANLLKFRDKERPTDLRTPFHQPMQLPTLHFLLGTDQSVKFYKHRHNTCDNLKGFGPNLKLIMVTISTDVDIMLQHD